MEVEMRNEKLLLSNMADKWPSNWVCRQAIEQFTGGIINPRSLANWDCKGKGPKGRVRIGKKVAYPVKEVIRWLEKKAVALD